MWVIERLRGWWRAFTRPWRLPDPDPSHCCCLAARTIIEEAARGMPVAPAPVAPQQGPPPEITPNPLDAAARRAAHAAQAAETVFGRLASWTATPAGTVIAHVPAVSYDWWVKRLALTEVGEGSWRAACGPVSTPHGAVEVSIVPAPSPNGASSEQ